MKFATILPTAYLYLIDGKPYHMALAHLIGKDAAYTNFYKKQADTGSYVILDNGVIEGEQQSIEQLCRKAAMIHASEIILPDTFLNCSETLDKSYDALGYVKKYFPNLKVMVVPQGKTLEEWSECVDIMLTWPVDTIGIPKVLTTMGGRDARLEELKRLGYKLRGLNIHLLGCWDNPLECTMIAKAEQQGDILPIRGVDSAIAYVYAREKMLITQGPRPSGEINFKAKDADNTCLEANIAIWEAAGNLEKEKVTHVNF